MKEELELEDNPRIVPKKSYLPELEEKVAFFMRNTADSVLNEIDHKRSKIPVFENDTVRRIWEREEIRRCKHGYNGMCGKMYFYFNYCWIKNISGGRIAPQYRVCDNEWFTAIEQAERSSWGLICVKRRRAGFSWKAAADALHDATFRKYYFTGMNSKTDRDSRHLFTKVKFLYDNLPPFLRATITASNTAQYMDFSYYVRDANNQKRKRGNQSEILVVPPTDTAFEGQMLNKWICDEAGKIPNLPQMWSYTEDCMMEETIRKGTPILFGTSGEIGKEGRGLKDMWDSADVHKLKKFFFSGWMGILCDNLGNDMKEEAIRWIIYERHRRRDINAKFFNDFIQRYPLTVAEAFQQASTGGLGDIIKINAQMHNLTENPIKAKKGKFILDSLTDKVRFVPDNTGACTIFEEPKVGRMGLYISGCDPADHDDAYDEASDLSMYIMSKPDGDEPPHIVFEYTDRPKNLVEYYEQAMLALVYYNNAKILIEDNRFRMTGYFKENGYGFLLQTTPSSYVRLFGGSTTKIGFRKTNASTKYLEELVHEYVDDYYDLIPSMELLQEFIQYGSRNTDRAIAFGITLMILKEDKRRIRMQDTYRTNYTPNFSYKRDSFGNIVRVDRRQDEFEKKLEKWGKKA